MKEIWKDIPGYKGLYKVSSNGRVMSLQRIVSHYKGGNSILKEHIMEMFINKPGYIQLRLTKNTERKTFKVHQLVAMAFLNHIPNGMKLVVNHINFNRTDNRVENLEIVTARQNANRKHLKSSSKFTGVSWDKQRTKWISKIRIKGKTKYLGRFKCELAAAAAYNNKLKTL